MKNNKKKLQQQEQLERELEERKRKAAEMKIDMNKITFDTQGNMMHKKKINCDRLPKVGKETGSKYKFSQSHLIRNDSNLIKKKLRELGARRVIMSSESNKQDPANQTSVKRKDIYKDIDPLANFETTGDKFALGSVDICGSNFNAFKPSDGVTVIEGDAKVKKGDKIKSSMEHLSRDDYLKTFSHKPFELKSILSNTQSLKNLDPKRANQISFYQDSTLPPIVSPRDRYKTEREENLTHDFELDQSAIPKKVDEMVVKAGDVSELLNLEKTFLDNTHEITNDSYTQSKKVTFSLLPKFVNR